MSVHWDFILFRGVFLKWALKKTYGRISVRNSYWCCVWEGMNNAVEIWGCLSKKSNYSAKIQIFKHRNIVYALQRWSEQGSHGGSEWEWAGGVWWGRGHLTLKLCTTTGGLPGQTWTAFPITPQRAQWLSSGALGLIICWQSGGGPELQAGPRGEQAEIRAGLLQTTGGIPPHWWCWCLDYFKHGMGAWGHWGWEDETRQNGFTIWRLVLDTNLPFHFFFIYPLKAVIKF